MAYETLLIRREGAVAWVTLNRPPANAINMQMCNELIALLDELETDANVQGLVLTGRKGMFSAGLDIIALRKLNRGAMTLFWTRFCQTFGRLWATPLTTAAAISGHSPAGGCVLSLACDYRAMAAGEYKIGLNEVAVGLPVPDFLCQVHARTVGNRNAERLLQFGTMVQPAEALAIGLVDAVVEHDELAPLVSNVLAQRLKAPPAARAATKRNLRRWLVEEMDANLAAQVEELADGWFSDECTTVMGALIAKLTARR